MRSLQRKGVVWGHSDPNLDPCGYRSLMVMQLAAKYYDKPDLYEKLLANRPEQNVRPKSVELISLLQSGNMDYAWEYLSVAVQHEAANMSCWTTTSIWATIKLRRLSTSRPR